MAFRLSIVVLIAALSTSAHAQETPLNILWLVADDMSPDMGCYGDVYARTPNLDKLAREGLRFTNAFSVHGQCSPSRSALITGMFPTTIGTHHMRSQAVPQPYVKCFTEYMRATGYYCTNNAKTDYNLNNQDSIPSGIFKPPTGAWDESGNKAHWRNRPKGMPFFSVFNFPVTHESRIRFPQRQFDKITASLGADDRHDPAKASLPPYYPESQVIRGDWARYYDLVTVMDQEVGALLRQLAEDGLDKNTVVIFFGDHGRGLPRSKRWLYDSGIKVPLIVRWPGHVKAGSIRDEVVSFVDFAPTMLRLANAEVPAHLQGRAFLGPKKEDPPEFIFATRDRSDTIYDMIRAVRDTRYKYLRNFRPEIPYAQPIPYRDLMPTMQDWRRLADEGKLEGAPALFFRDRKPDEELYDTLTDPYEIENLAADAEHAERLARMREALDDWMVETADLGRVDEADMLEEMRPGGVWSTTLSPVVRPAAGRFVGAVRVSISCATDGSSIVYRMGEDARWRLYVGPISLEEDTILHVKAGRLGYKDSPEERLSYSIEARR